MVLEEFEPHIHQFVLIWPRMVSLLQQLNIGKVFSDFFHSRELVVGGFGDGLAACNVDSPGFSPLFVTQ